MMSQLQQTIQMIKSSGNPEALINQMVNRNPQVRQILDQYGGDPKTAFYKYAQANGIDPDEVIKMLK